MKRILITLLAILIGFPLVLGGILALTYELTGESSIPEPTVKLMKTTLKPTEYSWHTPVFAGMMYKDFTKTGEQDDVVHLGTLTGSQMEVSVPSGYDNSVRVTMEDTVRWEGAAEDLPRYEFIDNGEYTIEVICNRAISSGKGYGYLAYKAQVTVATDVRVEISSETVRQGDVLALRVFNLSGGEEVYASSVLGTVSFADTGDGTMTGYQAANYNLLAQAINITVYVDGRSFAFRVNIVESNYPDQEMGEEAWALGSAVGYAATSLEPLYEEIDAQMHWSDSFLSPVAGSVLTQYGSYTTNEVTFATGRSEGIDIAASPGDEVVAPAAGRVVFAGEITGAGNAVVIEHGAGLKSYLYNLGELNVAEGQMVTRGDVLGRVGGGATAEAILHYEVRVGHRPIDPTLLIDGSGGVFYFTRS